MPKDLALFAFIFTLIVVFHSLSEQDISPKNKMKQDIAISAGNNISNTESEYAKMKATMECKIVADAEICYLKKTGDIAK